MILSPWAFYPLEWHRALNRLQRIRFTHWLVTQQRYDFNAGLFR